MLKKVERQRQETWPLVAGVFVLCAFIALSVKVLKVDAVEVIAIYAIVLVIICTRAGVASNRIFGRCGNHSVAAVVACRST